MNRIYTEISTVAGKDKPYELCISEHSEDGTRISHEDYLLTLNELRALHSGLEEKLRMLQQVSRYLRPASNA